MDPMRSCASGSMFQLTLEGPFCASDKLPLPATKFGAVTQRKTKKFLMLHDVRKGTWNRDGVFVECIILSGDSTSFAGTNGSGHQAGWQVAQAGGQSKAFTF